MYKTKQRFGKILLIVFSLLFVFNGAMISNAQTNNSYAITPYYVNISNLMTDFQISGIKAECKASIKANKSTTLKIKMELQKEKSNGYETVETWTDNKTGTILAMSESRNINVLCNYRLKVTFTAGNETEVVYKY